MAATYEQIKRLAQRDADNTGKSMAILNLNRYAPLYVVREYTPKFEDGTGYGWASGFVARIDPSNET